MKSENAPQHDLSSLSDESESTQEFIQFLGDDLDRMFVILPDSTLGSLFDEVKVWIDDVIGQDYAKSRLQLGLGMYLSDLGCGRIVAIADFGKDIFLTTKSYVGNRARILSVLSQIEVHKYTWISQARMKNWPDPEKTWNETFLKIKNVATRVKTAY
ncbi:MAG: hypothetical protein ABI758_00300 [Candidatus Woesebacteria bacterium]